MTNREFRFLQLPSYLCFKQSINRKWENCFSFCNIEMAKHASHVHSGTVHVHEVSLHWFYHTTPTILYPPSGRIPWLGFLKPSLFLGVYQIYFVLPNPNPGVSTLSLMIVIAYFYCLCCYFYCYIHCCYCNIVIFFCFFYEHGMYQIYFVPPNPNPGVSTLSLFMWRLPALSTNT